MYAHVRLVAAVLLMTTPVPSWAQTSTGTWPPVAPIREETAGPHPIQVTTKVRYVTSLEFPKADPLMDVIAGDGGSEEKPSNWVITAVKPAAIVLVKPTKEGAATNLKVLTASGAIYEFLLREGRADGKPLTMPDLRVTVISDIVAGVEPARKFYAAEEYDAVQAEVITLKAQLEAERQRAAETSPPAPKTTTPAVMHFAYGTVPDVKPFHVKAIWDDGKFTYIKHEASESPAIYEVKDGKPSILDPKVPEPGLFVVHKVLDSGYLAIGKARFPFARKQD